MFLFGVISNLNVETVYGNTGKNNGNKLLVALKSLTLMSFVLKKVK